MDQNIPIKWGLRPGIKLKKIGHINRSIPIPFIIDEEYKLQTIKVPQQIKIENFEDYEEFELTDTPELFLNEVEVENSFDNINNVDDENNKYIAADDPLFENVIPASVQDSPVVGYQTLKLKETTGAGVSTVIYQIPVIQSDQNDSLESILKDLQKSIERDQKNAEKRKRRAETLNCLSDEDSLNGNSPTSDYESGSTDNIFKQNPVQKSQNCRLCAQSFATVVLRIEHEKTVHRDSATFLYKCPQCEVKTKSLFLLQSHIGRHTGFVCDICGKVFATRIYLSTHQVVHAEETPFECHMCPKAFKNKYRLNRHLDRHTDRRPFQCNQCDKAYKDYTDLKRHKYTHGGVIPKFACSYCGKKFFENKYLKKHTQIHLKIVKVEKIAQSIE